MQYNFKAPCQKNRLVEIRKFLNDILKRHIPSDIVVHSLVLAVDEVCANLMIHSHNCNPRESIELKISVEKKKIIFEIKDKGNGFDFKEYKEPSIQEILIEKKKGGLGLMLVRRIMDKVEFKKDHNCNIYKLHKKIKDIHP